MIYLDKYKPIFDMAKKAGKLAREDNIRVYIVGGAVRAVSYTHLTLPTTSCV